MRVALDTNRLTDLFQGDADLESVLEVCEEIWLPLVVLAEIKAGFYGGARVQSNEAVLRRFLDNRSVGVLLPTLETAEQYARLYAQLRRAGTPIPDNDLWIAALAIQHDLRLISRDRHFERIPQLLLG